jgi:ubiquinone/menaquinone biosynthesis C-methylase UbiE
MPPGFDVKRFNRWAATYDRSVMQKWYFGPVHSRMLNLVEKEKRAESPHDIIDVGCGTGRLLRAASRRWPQAHLFGVDPAERMISEAERLSPNVTFRVGPAELLPLPDQAADLIVSSLSFHHWHDQSKGLQEISRVLRPGGLLCLADLTSSQVQELIHGVGLKVVRHQRLWSRFVLITLAQK